MDLRLYSGHIWKLWLNAIPMFMDYIPVQGIQAIYKSHRFQGLEAGCVGIFRARPVIEGIQALFFLTVKNMNGRNDTRAIRSCSINFP